MSASDHHQPERPCNEEKGPSALTAVLLVVGVAALLALVIFLDCIRSAPPAEETVPTEVMVVEETEGVHLVSEVTVCSTGDLMMHAPIFDDGYAAECYENGEYDFSTLFKYLTEYTASFDYAVANLETTFYGAEKPFQGYPTFNTPPQLAPALKDAGFDLLLTANNHCNDMGLEGIFRTIRTVHDRNMLTLGTNLSAEEEKYQIVDLNGIKIGMLCYTYEDSKDSSAVTLNGTPLDPQGSNLVCTFPLYGGEEARAPFYQKLSEQVTKMRQKGADTIVLYIHWGEEYRRTPTDDQKEMAQKLCDLGVDLIIGSHPHVIQSVELLSGTENPGHKTVCVYSLGNAVSNQRLGSVDGLKSACTEDGMLFLYTLQKYSDGRVCLSKVDVIPTWVNLFGNETGRREYNILPLYNERREQWQDLYDLTGTSLTAAWNSYDRTMNAVGKGLGEINIYLTQLKNRWENENLCQ